MTEEQLQAISARVNKATPGKWGAVPIYGEDEFYVYGDNMNEGVASEVYEKEDAEFIAHAREDVPALLAEVERLREALEFYANENNYDTPSDYGIGLYCEVTDDNGVLARRVLNIESHARNYRVNDSNIDALSPEVIIVSCENCRTLLSVGRNENNRKRSHFCSSECKGAYLSASGGDR